jgi:hypothetical protein
MFEQFDFMSVGTKNGEGLMTLAHHLSRHEIRSQLRTEHWSIDQGLENRLDAGRVAHAYPVETHDLCLFLFLTSPCQRND